MTKRERGNCLTCSEDIEFVPGIPGHEWATDYWRHSDYAVIPVPGHAAQPGYGAYDLWQRLGLPDNQIVAIASWSNLKPGELVSADDLQALIDAWHEDQAGDVEPDECGRCGFPHAGACDPYA